jgi:hypothetical protein
MSLLPKILRKDTVDVVCLSICPSEIAMHLIMDGPFNF